MTSLLPAFPAQIWVGWEQPKRRKRSPAPGPTPVEVDAAIWLAGLTPTEMGDVFFWRVVRLTPRAGDLAWAQSRLASLRSAWEKAKAQSAADGNPDNVLMSVGLSGGQVVEWLHQNVFATFLQSASLYLHAYGELVPVILGRVVADVDGGKDMKTLILENIGDIRVVTVDFDLIADALTALVRFCAATNPEMRVDLMRDLAPYLVGSTPQGQWMSVDHALAYREAGVTSGEARRLEFGAAKDRPSLEALRTLTALNT